MGYRLWSKAEGRRPKVAGRGGHLRHVVRWRYFHDIRPDDFDPLEAAQIRQLGNYRATTATVAGQPAAVSRTGYTGEDGVELVVAAAAAVPVWEAIHAAGAPAGLLA